MAIPAKIPAISIKMIIFLKTPFCRNWNDYFKAESLVVFEDTLYFGEKEFMMQVLIDEKNSKFAALYLYHVFLFENHVSRRF